MFVIALAYLFCLALVGSCLARFANFLAHLCTLQQLQQKKVNAKVRDIAPHGQTQNATRNLRSYRVELQISARKLFLCDLPLGMGDNGQLTQHRKIF